MDAGFWLMGTNAVGLLGILVAGRLSDRLGRRLVLGVCMAGTALLLGLCGFLPPTMAIPAMLVVASFFQGSTRPLISASIMDLCPKPLRKEGFSLCYLGSNLGIAVGPMIAGFLFEHHLRWVFFGNGIALACAIAILFRFVPGSRPGAADSGTGSERAFEGSMFRALTARPILLVFFGLTLLLSFSYSQTSFGLTLYTAEAFGERSAAIFGFLMSFNAITVLASTALITRLTHRMSALMAMALGTALYVVGFGMLSFRLGLGLLVVSTFIWTLGEVVLAINTGPFLASQSPSNFRGRFQSFREIMWGIGSTFSPMICGAIIVSRGIHLSWLVTALAALGCTIGFALLRRGEKGGPAL